MSHILGYARVSTVSGDLKLLSSGQGEIVV
jgi:hypothetical protein